MARGHRPIEGGILIGQSATRTIHTRACAHQIPDLLQVIFTAELIRPSSQLWLVSPWISDIPLLDNSDLGFRVLQPSWPRNRIRLSAVLARLAELGTLVHIVLSNDEHNRYIRAALQRVSKEAKLRIFTYTDDMNHSKGILGDRFSLSGSMNLTLNGIGHNGETVHFNVDPAIVAASRIEFQSRWSQRTK
jgi:phosphatidylserine/phosphatidylglycerophosphate/cardiolipin synthase-like enzyme